MKHTKTKSGKAGNIKGKRRIVKKPEPSAAGKSVDPKELVHSLQVNLIELEHQNHELRIVESELESSRSKYVNLFDFSPMPYFTLDPGGIIKEINLSAARMLGSYRNNLIGRDLHSYILPEDKSSLKSFLKAVFNSSVKQSTKLNMINKDKREFHVLLEGLASDDTQESGVHCYIAVIDLTEYKKLEESLRKTSEELKLLKARKRGGGKSIR